MRPEGAQIQTKNEWRDEETEPSRLAEIRE